MPIRSIRIYGSYQEAGKIKLENGNVLDWKLLDKDVPPLIPFGTVVEVNVSFEERDFLNGTRGVVWATYDLRQAEIIRDALFSQNIVCRVDEENLKDYRMHLVTITNGSDVQTAIDFIWRDNSGLRLKPDWEYPAGAVNESFNRWISGI